MGKPNTMVSEPRKSSRIPASLQAVFLHSNRGFTVDKPPPERTASKVFFRRFIPTSKQPVSTAVVTPEKPQKVHRCSSINTTSTWSLASTEFMISPQEHLVSIVTSRGYVLPSTYQPVAMFGDRDDPPERLPEAHYDAHIVDIVKRDNPEPLRALLSAGISQNPCFSIGESIASLACRFGSIEILKVLLDAGCDPTATDQYGRTCLHEACRAVEPNWVIVALLLDRHVGSLFTKDAYGMTPLAYVKPLHSDVWIEFLNSKATVYFPRKSGGNAQALVARVSSGSAMVSSLTNGIYNQERDGSNDGSDSSEVEIEDESSSSNESLSDVLFSAYENEMAELVALMDARMGRKK